MHQKQERRFNRIFTKCRRSSKPLVCESLELFVSFNHICGSLANELMVKSGGKK